MYPAMLSSLIGLLGLYFWELTVGSRFISSWNVKGWRFFWHPAKERVAARAIRFFILSLSELFPKGISVRCFGFLRIVIC